MDINDIIKYVTCTPNNSNPAVLRSMLEDLQGGGGDTTDNITIAKVTCTGDGALPDTLGFEGHIITDEIYLTFSAAGSYCIENTGNTTVFGVPVNDEYPAMVQSMWNENQDHFIPISVTGSAFIDDGGGYGYSSVVISGDCTITVGPYEQ